MATAVLVHGAWSSPSDWRWVAECLHAHGIATVIPDLPSHRYRWAGRSDDVDELEIAIRRAEAPVVVAGWSYGGAVISDLAETGPIERLVYVGSYPEPVAAIEGPSTSVPPSRSELESTPHMLFPDEATVVLDDDWWLSSADVAAFPAEVIAHLRDHRRRPITTSALLAPAVAEAWRKVPITILLGSSDATDEQDSLRAQFSDVRIVDGDHFLPLLQPDLVAGVIAEAFERPPELPSHP